MRRKIIAALSCAVMAAGTAIVMCAQPAPPVNPGELANSDALPGFPQLADATRPRTRPGNIYFVSPTGNDADPGTEAKPWMTIQAVVSKLQPGDTLNVLPGTFSGFAIGWDDPNSGPYSAINGNPADPITIQAAPGSPAGSVIISSRNHKTPDGIDIENSNYIIIQGFTINNAAGNIDRAGIRTVTNHNITLRNNVLDHNGTWGIFTAFSDNLLIEGNTAAHSAKQHGIYVSNSGDNPIVRNNISFGNKGCGIHLNGDLSMGGDGIITNALIEGNIIHDNGASGGSAINLDGVQKSRIQNNLIYNNHASGISLFLGDGAQASKDNIIVNNTIIMPPGSRWALNIGDGSTGNVVYNNILLNAGARGAITIDAASMPGFFSDWNAVTDKFTTDDGDTMLKLAQWQTAGKQDAHSIVATAAQLFVNAAADDYHLAPASPALDRGANIKASPAPAKDLEAKPRPAGAGMDLGAYELQPH